MRVFRDLKAFTSHLRNFRQLRIATDALINEWGPPGQATAASMSSGSLRAPRQSFSTTNVTSPMKTQACIPFLGLFLRDLAISDELPTWIDPSAPHQPVDPSTVDPASGLISPLANPTAFDGLINAPPLPEGVRIKALVNVHKYRTIAHIVTKVLVCSEMATLYPFEPDPQLYRKTLALRCVLASPNP